MLNRETAEPGLVMNLLLGADAPVNVTGVGSHGGVSARQSPDESPEKFGPVYRLVTSVRTPTEYQGCTYDHQEVSVEPSVQGFAGGC